VGDAPAGAVVPEALLGFAGLWPIVEGARGRFCWGATSSALGSSQLEWVLKLAENYYRVAE